MTSRPNTYILLGTIFIILTWLFVGFYRDDEFYELKIFTKYRPTFKINFYSPIGMQDIEIDSLPLDKKEEEIAFREFVIKRHIPTNDTLWYLPLILIQLTITFFSLGIVKIKRNLVYAKWHLPTHFIICFLLTSIGLVFILNFDNWYITVFSGILILLINYGALVLIAKKSKI